MRAAKGSPVPCGVSREGETKESRYKKWTRKIGAKQFMEKSKDDHLYGGAVMMS
jgi:hypothetical protein